MGSVKVWANQEFPFLTRYTYNQVCKKYMYLYTHMQDWLNAGLEDMICLCTSLERALDTGLNTGLEDMICLCTSLERAVQTVTGNNCNFKKIFYISDGIRETTIGGYKDKIKVQGEQSPYNFYLLVH